MSGQLLLRDRLRIVRAVWPTTANRPDHALYIEQLEVEIVLAGGRLVPGDEAKEREIREKAKEMGA